MSNYTEEVRKDVNALAKNARALIADTRNMAGEKVGAARQRLSDALGSAQEICGQMRQKAMGGVTTSDKVVRDHPYQAIGIALGVGALLGFLLTRRKNGCSTSEKQDRGPSLKEERYEQDQI